MERLTAKRQLKYDTANCLSTEYVSRPIFSNGDEIVFGEAIDRLAAYEDTGFTPEEISQQRFFIAALKDPEKLARLRDIVLADEAGRLVVLDKPRKPLVWGDDAHDTVLCPNCNHDLMGGFPEGESCEMPMYQCPYCGQPIDDEKALTRQEAEAALKEEPDNVDCE